MRKIDVSEWKEFKVGDLFELKLSHDDIQPNNCEDGDIPVISSGSSKNGIAMHKNQNSGFEIFPSGSMTIDMFGKAFYHNYEYYAVSHGRVNILVPKTIINKFIGLFLCSTFEAGTKGKYSFTNMCNQKKLKEETILLPATPDGAPDWQYMEEYIRQLLEESEAAIGNLRQLKEKKKINVEGWKEFRVGDLGFEIIHGARQTKADREDGDIPLLTAGKENQGLAEHISNPLVTCTGAISIDMFGNSFFHKGKYAGDDNIYFFVNSHLSSLSKMFISFVINKYNEGKYGYNHQFRQSQADNLVIPLPATLEGKPNYDFMESYIQGMMEKTADHIDMLK